MASKVTRLCGLLFSVSCYGVALQQEVVQADLGKIAVLQCFIEDPSQVLVVWWYKAGNHEEYVLCFKDETMDPDGQDKAYVGRVDLRTRNMTGGDLSMVLKNVMVLDKGTYKCVATFKSNRQRRSDVCRVTLDSPQTDPVGEQQNRGTVHMGAIIVPFMLLSLPLFIFLFNRCIRQQIGRAQTTNVCVFTVDP